MTYLDRMRLLDKLSGKDHTCHYCKRVMLAYKADMSLEDLALSATKDHVIPKALGGLNTDDNYKVCCARCNRLKGHIPYPVFKEFANIVLCVYPDLPLPHLRNSLNLYIMALLERSCSNKQIMRTACSVALLKLKDEIDEHEGKRVRASRKKK